MTSKIGLLPLQAAIVTLLKGDSALTTLVTTVTDFVPDNQPYPYVIVGDNTSLEFRTHTGHGEEDTVTIHIWSQHRGSKEVLQIMDEIIRLLGDVTNVTVTDFDFIASWFDFSEVLRDPDGETQHGVMRFRVKMTQTRV